MLDRNELTDRILSNFQSIRRNLALEGRNMHRHFGVTISQATALSMLNNTTSMTLTDIAENLGISKSATTQLLDSLIAHGLLIREADLADGRVFNISISSKGSSYLSKIKRRASGSMVSVFQVLSVEELSQLAAITEKLLNPEI